MDADAKIAIHEAECTLRYKAIDERLERGQKKMDSIQMKLNVLLILVLVGPSNALELIKKYFLG